MRCGIREGDNHHDKAHPKTFTSECADCSSRLALINRATATLQELLMHAYQNNTAAYSERDNLRMELDDARETISEVRERIAEFEAEI